VLIKVIEFDEIIDAMTIEEKPTSNSAVPSTAFHDNSVIETAKTTEPSARGQLEITTTNEWDLGAGNLQARDRGAAWLDTETFDSMMQSSEYVHVA
jgi:glucose-1-phosphate thymidylyltransferase